MWERTKRVINSYLEELIERSTSPDKQVRQITRAEIARLNELEVQARGSIKLLEKELAEVELKMLGVAERERITRERGDAASATTAGDALISLSKQRDLLKQQIAEANSSAERARSLREERRRVGEELANETHLTAMRENLAGIQTPFDHTDPSGTIDEMRGRLGLSGLPSVDSRLADAEREFEAERAHKAADELLARYKESLGVSPPSGDQQSQRPVSPAQPPPPQQTNRPTPAEDEPVEPKTLGRTDGPLRPID
jgi:phage shock protein A